MEIKRLDIISYGEDAVAWVYLTEGACWLEGRDSFIIHANPDDFHFKTLEETRTFLEKNKPQVQEYIANCNNECSWVSKDKIYFNMTDAGGIRELVAKRKEKEDS